MSNYSSADGPRWSKLALFACFIGIIAGPTMWLLAPHLGFSGRRGEQLAGLFLPTFIGVFIGVIAMLHVENRRMLRGYAFAITGIIMALAWPAGMIARELITQ